MSKEKLYEKLTDRPVKSFTKNYFKYFFKKFIKPFVDLKHRKFLNALKDLFKITPVGIAMDFMNEIAYLQATVYNLNTSEITVVVKNKPVWIFSDLASTILQIIATMGTDVPEELALLKNAKTIGEFIEGTQTLRNTASFANRFFDFFAKDGTEIKPKDFKEVHRKPIGTPSNFLSPSEYAALFDANDISYFIISKTGKCISFDSNSGYSWIVTWEGIQRASANNQREVDGSQKLILWR